MNDALDQCLENQKNENVELPLIFLIDHCICNICN